MAHKSEIYDAIEKLAEAKGVDVGIVIGGGNICRGRIFSGPCGKGRSRC